MCNSNHYVVRFHSFSAAVQYCKGRSINTSLWLILIPRDGYEDKSTELCTITVSCDEVNTFVDEQRDIVGCQRLVTQNIACILYINTTHDLSYRTLLASCTLTQLYTVGKLLEPAAKLCGSVKYLWVHSRLKAFLFSNSFPPQPSILSTGWSRGIWPLGVWHW